MILERYTELCNKPSDIYEHLPTLKQYTEKCDTVVEMGVRWIVSTWAFLAGNPKRLISYDIMHPCYYDGDIEEVYEAVKETPINFQFKQENVLETEIEPVDLLFIDTLHSYEQLSKELEIHSKKVKKYIIMHDTTTYATKGEINWFFAIKRGEDKGRGLWLAIEEFLEINKEWEIEARHTNNNGLTILKRK